MVLDLENSNFLNFRSTNRKITNNYGSDPPPRQSQVSLRPGPLPRKLFLDPRMGFFFGGGGVGVMVVVVK